MTVTFVPPRTLIRAAAPTTSVNSAASYIIQGDEVDDQDDDLYGDVEMGGLDEHGGGSLLTKKLVVPGQLVTDDPQFMRYLDILILCSQTAATEPTSVKKKKSSPQ
jgi:hypothetical protein